MAKSANEKNKLPKPPPKCKALLLCEQVIVDAFTGRGTIVGLIDGFTLKKIPGTIRPFSAFLQLGDGNGSYGLSVEIHDLEKDKIIGRGSGMSMDFKEKLSKVNAIIPIPPMKIKHAGDYDLIVKANDQEIDRQKFAVHLLKAKGDKNEK